MRQTILDFPKQFRQGFELAKNVGVSGKFDGVLICGIGGSALPGEILNAWVNTLKTPFPIYINRDYNVLSHIKKNYLAICISYSGNTEETLSCFDKISKDGFKIAVIASGGKLAELCQKNGIPLALIPKGYQPRMALGFQFAALVKILSNSGLIKDNLGDILDLEKSLKPGELETRGRTLTTSIGKKIPVIYASNDLKSLAQIWKIKFNENSEIPAFCNYFPELNHNEMMGFSRYNDSLHMIILRNPTDHPRTLKRMTLTANLLKTKGFRTDFVEIRGKNILEKIFSNIILGDWASYYSAIERGIDPTPVEMNELFKKRMSK
ncbi:MAG: bifunctional phosphoglucose/phosphomannose isomerase [Patescibacteria group bacterium]